MGQHDNAAGDASPQEQAWRRMATEMFGAGASEDEVQNALRKSGCLAHLRREICEQARRAIPVDRGAHRRAGLKAFLFGVALCALGAALWTFAALHHLEHPGDTASLSGGRVMILASIACFVTGFTPALFGLWKLATGSSVAIVAPRR